jgi:hypothetical protein
MIDSEEVCLKLNKIVNETESMINSLQDVNYFQKGFEAMKEKINKIIVIKQNISLVFYNKLLFKKEAFHVVVKAANCILMDTKENNRNIIVEINSILYSALWEPSIQITDLEKIRKNKKKFNDNDSVCGDFPISEGSLNINSNNSSHFIRNNFARQIAKIKDQNQFNPAQYKNEKVSLEDTIKSSVASDKTMDANKNFRFRGESTALKSDDSSDFSNEVVSNKEQESYTVFEIYEDKIISKTKFVSSSDKDEENLIFQYQINL